MFVCGTYTNQGGQSGFNLFLGWGGGGSIIINGTGTNIPILGPSPPAPFIWNR
jgi:hypothetical protein